MPLFEKTWSVRGLQLAGVANVAVDSVCGASIAPVKVATGEVRGVQIGVVSIAEQSDFSLGVVNVNTRGRTHPRVILAPPLVRSAAPILQSRIPPAVSRQAVDGEA